MKRNMKQLISKGTYNPKRCAYCGKVLSDDKKTRDHVPVDLFSKNITTIFWKNGLQYRVV